MHRGINPVVLCLAVFSLLNIGNTIPDLKNINYKSNNSVWLQDYHRVVVDTFMRKRNNWTTSVLGDVLFKNKPFPPIDKYRQNKTFQVLLWRYQNSFAYRYFYNFGSSNQTVDPLEACSVKNCNFHGNQKLLHHVDAVVFFVGGNKIPKVLDRKSRQKWIFFTDESPVNAFFDKHYNFYKHAANKFNWSMTYRSDSDIPIPYGRTIPLEKPLPVSTHESLTQLIPNWDKKDTKNLVAAMITNCHVKYRLKIIEQLQEYIYVDFYGRCGDETFRVRCPGRFKSKCRYLSQYYFYLALENSHCRQYISEKVFYNAYYNGAIPIIKGAPVADCEKLLPPHSFLHIDNFKSIEALAQEIVYISENIERLLSYHLWRAHFKVTRESENFGVQSTALCRVCEALNYNNMEPSIYTLDDVKLFMEQKIVCDMSLSQETQPIIIRKAIKPMCYELGKESCIEL